GGMKFGGSQALLPTIGCFIGITFASFIASIDHLICFVLLYLLGLKISNESLEIEICDRNAKQFGFQTMQALTIDTSIDALAVGVSFAFLNVNLLLAIFLIGIITFILCIIALKIGNKFGIYLKNKAELLGGLVLIILGVKI
uniref:manganese efflux pump n=1 Tax=Klebsiella pneumoniae TaxID=573 RepID=UPI0013C364AD